MGDKTHKTLRHRSDRPLNQARKHLEVFAGEAGFQEVLFSFHALLQLLSGRLCHITPPSGPGLTAQDRGGQGAVLFEYKSTSAPRDYKTSIMHYEANATLVAGVPGAGKPSRGGQSPCMGNGNVVCFGPGNTSKLYAHPKCTTYLSLSGPKQRGQGSDHTQHEDHVTPRRALHPTPMHPLAGTSDQATKPVRQQLNINIVPRPASLPLDSTRIDVLADGEAGEEVRLPESLPRASHRASHELFLEQIFTCRQTAPTSSPTNIS
ncbi:hypothetical protein JHW43_004918 [Diplocarpon mali]|nr:hypothetical protein JHW43_004918 [Diplocarpon mali]